ncbi:MAG: efflux RND transporter permease subunit [Defluviitaleaceae bacterium]|nr:efflux RND transporter permease subunit [Defluviitaleaceae bacterium]
MLFSKKDSRVHMIFWLGLLGIMLLRTFFFGFSYFLFLDDYNTYGIFNRRNADIWNDIILFYGHYTWRPLAFFADAYITQWFFNSFEWVLLFYTFLHFFIVLLFYNILKKSNLNFGALGILIISLSPLLFESVYWIGASTRLLPAMFFSLIAIYFMLKDKYLLFAIFSFIQTGFYEQMIVFHLAFSIAIILINGKSKKLILIPILASIFMASYYFVFDFLSDGRAAGRMQFISFSDILLHPFRVLFSAFNTLFRTNFFIHFYGLPRGFLLLNTIPYILLSLLVVIFSVFVFLNLQKEKLSLEEFYDNPITRLILGVVLIIAPLAPFFILEEIWLPARTVFASIFGLAIFADTLFSLLPKFLKSSVCALFIVPAFLVYIAEVNNFRLIWQVDTIVINNFLEVFEEEIFEENIETNYNIVLLNTSYIIAPVTFSGNHRLENITSSSWALLGGLNSTSREHTFRNVMPVQNSQTLPDWENLIFLGIDEYLNIFHLTLDGYNLYSYEHIFGVIENNSFILNKPYIY